MDKAVLERHFARSVAPLDIRRWGRVPTDDFTVDVGRDHHGESFILRLGQEAEAAWDFQVTNADPERKHLVLTATPTEGKEAPRRFLCGHDERHLFVAGIAAPVSTVDQAMESLKPSLVRQAQDDRHVRPKLRNRRRNPGFVRQGEWFFLPVPDFDPPRNLILHNEPLRRGRGKIHRVEWLYRVVGQAVYVCSKYPDGIADEDYRRIVADDPRAKAWGWRIMSRTQEAYAKGHIRHADHRTLILPCWHRIVVNGEIGTSVAFLD